jgi:hypothetical protein
MSETLITTHYLCKTYLEWYEKQISYGLGFGNEGNLDNKKTYIQNIIVSHQKCKEYGLCSNDRSHMDNETRFIINVSVLITSVTRDLNPPQLSHTISVVTLALGSQPRQGFTRVRAKREAHECGRVWEWTIKPPNELPLCLGVGVPVDSQNFREWL